MPKHNTKSFQRVERRVESRTFTDALQPGVEITLTLVEPDLATISWSESQGEAYADEWVRGAPYQVAVALNEMEMVNLTDDLCKALAMVEILQQPGEDAYSVEELIDIMRGMPGAWMEINAWAAEVVRRARALESASAAMKKAAAGN